jgi:phytoene dehydrogenase-like protein
VTPFPPVKAALRLVRALGSYRDTVQFARFALLPARRMADETFAGEGGGWLLGGNALHGDLTPEMNGGGMFGWLLCVLGQHVGFPVPRGGAGELTRALVRRLEGRGGQLVCGRRVTAILVRAGRAAGVRLQDGEVATARRAVLAGTSAPALYRDLLPADALPGWVFDALARLQLDNATVKVDWALDAPIPWIAQEAATSGTVHLADGMDGMTRASTQLAMHELPEHPFLILGQYSMTDPTRCPPGKEVAWAYTHVPHGTLPSRGEVEAFVERMEAEVERRAPGFASLVLDRHVQGPRDLQAANANLLDGAINDGSAQLHQQLVFRPIPGLGRPETPVPGVFLCSAAAHPGGGVHAGPGAIAARAALTHDRLRSLRRPRRGRG